MFKSLLFSMVFGSAVLGSFALASTPNAKPFDRPLVFEPNRGQAPAQFSWTARGAGYQLYLTSTGASIVLAEPVAQPAAKPASGFPLRLTPPERGLPSARISVVNMNLSGSHSWGNVEALEPTGGVSNYLVGQDRKDWHSGVPQYARLRVKGVYDGIDLVFYGHGHDLEYDFVVAPGGDPNQIRLAFDGVGQMRVDGKTGDLVVTTKTGSEMRHVRPRVYQQIGDQKVEVAGGYRILDNGQAAFQLAAYDRRNGLVVDPTVEFTTFLEGNLEDYTTGLAVDSDGNSYVLGETFSTDFPVTPGSSKPSKVCTNNVCPPSMFVAKLAPSGEIIYSTLIGGSAVDVATGIAVDATGVWVTGTTTSTNFATNHYYAFGIWNGFVAKFTPFLNQLDWCITFGGSGDENTFNTPNAIALDANHSAYVAGETFSIDFPVTEYFNPNLQAKQKVFGGDSDAFVVKVDPDGVLKNGYSTYLGGSNTDAANGIAVDSSGHAYVTGMTYSTNFPTNGPISYGSAANGGVISFITEMSQDGSSSIYSITLGGTKNGAGNFAVDVAHGITVNGSNEVYIVGTTCSSDFPTFTYSYQQQPPSPCAAPNSPQYFTSAFVAQLSQYGTLLFSTYLGGTNGAVEGLSVAQNLTGDVYVAGATTTSAFPDAPNIALNPSAGFVTKFGNTLQFLQSTTFLGATISNVVVTQPAPRLGIVSLVPPTTIYTAGSRLRPGTQNFDAFVVKLIDQPPPVTEP
jgi:Beta-propeller repeat